MNKQCVGCSLIFWLPVLCLALGPTASAVDGTVIVVTGVSAGDTEIVVQAGSEEFRVPVQVGG